MSFIIWVTAQRITMQLLLQPTQPELIQYILCADT